VDLAWQMTGASVTNSAHFQSVNERKSVTKQQMPEVNKMRFNSLNFRRYKDL